jgi:hypothetical protein
VFLLSVLLQDRKQVRYQRVLKGRLASEGFWMRNYGGGVRVAALFKLAYAGLVPQGLGPLTFKINVDTRPTGLSGA